MSEEKKPRTKEDLQREYSELCTKAGHLQYQVATLKKDLEMINGLLRDLNSEALSVIQAEKPAEEPKAA